MVVGAESSTETVNAFELGTAEKVVVTRLLGLLARAGEEGVMGGNPKMEPSVYGTKFAWTPV